MARPTKEEQAIKARVLSDKQLAFAVWFAQPVGLRDPATMDDLADVLGCTRQSLWRWSKDPRILDASRWVVLQNAGEPSKVIQVLDMIHTKAVKDQDVRYAELWLKAVGVMAANTNRDLSLWDAVTDETLDALSDDALQALKEAKAAELDEQARMEAARLALAKKPDVSAVEG
jgi:hypothetical protein